MKESYNELKEKLYDCLQDEEKAEAVLGIIEQFEMEEDRKRLMKQREGIKRARESGVALGRPKLKVPDNFEELLEEWENGIIKADMAARACGMGISTFYRRVRKYKDEKNLELNKQEA